MNTIGCEPRVSPSGPIIMRQTLRLVVVSNDFRISASAVRYSLRLHKRFRSTKPTSYHSRHFCPTGNALLSVLRNLSAETSCPLIYFFTWRPAHPPMTTQPVESSGQRRNDFFASARSHPTFFRHIARSLYFIYSAIRLGTGLRARYAFFILWLFLRRQLQIMFKHPYRVIDKVPITRAEHDDEIFLFFQLRDFRL